MPEVYQIDAHGLCWYPNSSPSSRHLTYTWHSCPRKSVVPNAGKSRAPLRRPAARPSFYACSSLTSAWDPQTRQRLSWTACALWPHNSSPPTPPVRLRCLICVALCCASRRCPLYGSTSLFLQLYHFPDSFLFFSHLPVFSPTATVHLFWNSPPLHVQSSQWAT